MWSNHLFYIAKCNHVFCSPNCQWQARGLLAEQQTLPRFLSAVWQQELHAAVAKSPYNATVGTVAGTAAPDACALISRLSVADDV